MVCGNLLLHHKYIHISYDDLHLGSLTNFRRFGVWNLPLRHAKIKKRNCVRHITRIHPEARRGCQSGKASLNMNDRHALWFGTPNVNKGRREAEHSFVNENVRYPAA